MVDVKTKQPSDWLHLQEGLSKRQILTFTQQHDLGISMLLQIDARGRKVLTVNAMNKHLSPYPCHKNRV